MNTPNHTTTAVINELWLLLEPTSPENKLDDKLAAMLSRVVVETDPCMGVVYMAYDPETYDPDPESSGHYYMGTGRSKAEAIADWIGRVQG